jgi:Uncharacterised nucleotidyltransferase
MTVVEAWGTAPGATTVWPTPSQELLLKAALLADERALLAWEEVRPEMEVARLDGPAQAVLPHVRANLTALGVEDELLGLFRGVHRYVWAQNQLLLNRMTPFLEELEQAGIPTLVLKGAGMVAGSRLDAGMRPMKDLDVLVPTGHTETAIEILAGGGLVPVSGMPTWFVTEYAPTFECGWGFETIEHGRSLRLDLHWHATYVSRQPDADHDFWEAAREVDLRGVGTRALAPADELLIAIVHGLHWDPLPTYRWVVDAALVARGESGPVDFDRLVEQARKRRVTAMVSAGLAYLRREFAAPIPLKTIRALRRSLPGPVERLELRALRRPPWECRPMERAVIRHQDSARQRVPLGRRRLLVHRAPWAAIAERRRPGPGRPASMFTAPIGTGRMDPDIEPVAIGETIDFGDPERVHRHFLYGAWFPPVGGCMLAGREARLALPLKRRPDSGLILSMSADPVLFPGHGTSQRLDVLVNGVSAARFSFHEGGPGLDGEAIAVPRAAVAGRDVIELTLRTPDATAAPLSPEEWEERERSIVLCDLVLREPVLCQPGQPLAVGAGSGDQALVAGGWSVPEPGGRWTYGSRARLLLRIADGHGPLDFEIEGQPIGEHQIVDLRVNRGRRSRLRWDGPARHRVPVAACDGEVLVDLRVKQPVSPAELGQSEDTRPLGLFVRNVGLCAR